MGKSTQGIRVIDGVCELSKKYRRRFEEALLVKYQLGTKIIVVLLKIIHYIAYSDTRGIK